MQERNLSSGVLSVFLIAFSVSFNLSAQADRMEVLTCECKRTIAQDQTALIEDPSVARPGKFDCLPKDVRLNDVVIYKGSGKENVTVEKMLVRMKAKCRNGNLIDRKRREIQFFRPSCWGNPTMNYREIQKQENEKLEQLKKRYTVIVCACNPMIQ